MTQNGNGTSKYNPYAKLRYGRVRKNFTVYTDEDLPPRIRALAEERDVSMADLATFLLRHAVSEMEAGRLEPETYVHRRLIIY